MFFQAVSATVKRSSGPPPSGPIAFRDSTATCLPNITFESGSPAVIDLPDTATSGDFVMVILSYDSSTTSDIVSASGWTKLTHVGDATPDAQFDIFYRIFNGTEGSTASFEPNGVLFTRDVYGYSFIVDYIDTANPFVLGTSNQCAICSTLNVTGITAPSDGRVLSVMATDGGDNNPFTITSGWTVLVDEDCDSTSSGLGTHISYKDVLSGAASGTLTYTMVAGASADGIAGVQVFMKQA